MNKQQTQKMVEDFHRWVGDTFLPKEESIEKGSKAWEGHLNRLTLMFSDFLFLSPAVKSLVMTDDQALISTYGDFVKERLGLPDMVDGNERLFVEHKYYVWPVCLYVGNIVHSAENN